MKTYGIRYGLIGLVLICQGVCVYAQGTARDSGAGPRIVRVSRLVLPIVYYTPETRWAAGAAGLYAFRIRGAQDSLRPSQIQPGVAVTQERQVLLYLPYRLWWGRRGYTAFGEWGYYRYTYAYFGIGPDTAGRTRETYDVTFPRVRVQGLRQVWPGWYLGGLVSGDWYKMRSVTPGGHLADPVRAVPGRQGGAVTSLGLIVVYDTRDQLFFPARGWYLEGRWQAGGRVTGSDYRFRRMTLDLSGYRRVVRGHVLAANVYADLAGGEVPFQAMGLLGGSRRMRGYFEGSFRDKVLLTVQAEYRIPLFWRIGGDVFGALGTVAPRPGAVSAAQVRGSGGAGLRLTLDKAQHINIRLDYGWGRDTQGVYLTVGEAF
jgi:hypothetical protein